MPYIPVRSGFTGPSNYIGGSSDYHIDLKISQRLSPQEQVKAFDSLAKHYASLGRKIEFSNSGVASQIYESSLPLEQKVNLLQRAAAAHAPRIHQGYNSFDFYVPFKGENRFGKSAEGASIFLPAVSGGKVRRGSGGGYGFYSESLDPSGQVLFRVGHGDTRRPETDGDINVLGNPPAAPELPPPPTYASSSDTSTANNTSNNTNADSDRKMRALLFHQMMEQMNQPSLGQTIIQQSLEQAMKPIQFQNYIG